ncbi:hypothetical protein P256_00338 [Acinetobacter nectaris CIP 110549]|uniref:HTH lysR-type domain-containing protein n=1 Tax=Acinetobacter nectaris CIP 110549 TaxID=1392540 RepID=V2TYV8_9GAMM|nr:LysR family transcriptional regulator [Acinetobacter nectaris]ESK40910.1 hypothetical protein P256_00338 [Acinetobacter nectaris CIP 110549]
MDLRHIKYFIAVAEEQSFSKAAQRLHMSQPPLSMQIKQLEEEIGTELFYRTSQGVSLTPSGKVFLKSVLPIQNQIHHAIRQTQSTANGDIGELRLGFTGTAILNPLIPKAIKAFQKEYPAVNLILTEANSLLLIEAILHNELDIAVIRPPKTHFNGISIQHLIEERLVAVLPQNYLLSDGKLNSLEALKNERFIVSPYEVSAGLFEATVHACQQSGFEPKFGPSAPQIVSILSLVAANIGVSLVPESTQQLNIKGIQYQTLDPKISKIGLGLAYKEDHHSQPAINFSSILHSLLHRIYE